MTAKQFRRAIDQIGLSQITAAHFLAIDPRTVRRYALGELPVPPLIAKVLDYMVKHNLTAEDFT
jgi:ribosome-binding protein aMBF1 (putative translation factor)